MLELRKIVFELHSIFFLILRPKSVRTQKVIVNLFEVRFFEKIVRFSPNLFRLGYVILRSVSQKFIEICRKSSVRTVQIGKKFLGVWGCQMNRGC